MANKVIIILGPTGVGKSSVAILLAKALDTEIISADSMQIYRHMDIGTAKPTDGGRGLVKHHMIDIVDPWDSYSTGRYIDAVLPVIEKLHSNGKIPIVAGGTGLYIKAMTRGIFSGPSADWIVREHLLSMEKEEKGSLYQILKDLDQEALQRINPNDTRRIVRAIEVCLKSASSMSEMQRRMTKPIPCEFIKIGLLRDRKELYPLIEQRVDEMISKGLIEEVKKVVSLIENMEKRRTKETGEKRISDLPLPSMQAIGYKEIALYLDGKITLEEAVRRIKRESKRYAKRQFTWFRKEEDIHWVDVTNINDNAIIFNLISDVLSNFLKN
jgi:tRNA dimethylallyltransferase